ncbi:hypothetical protein R4612_07565 [Acinetobacter baumannii]|uniref:hypothetical protein n=1 Tax=Acinetobacter baumannii TaxID=470 RepID=UPI001B31EEA0|nr:hypothetical protein [Acinetobacter baumannii]MBP4065293.1 hypothetical protein [Acinetobacter baumannii]MDH2549539.1 hypothetical protein [Acinetobacter baumannii]MDV7632130.1 hypothetical protein [Acinetobacter baumannii]MDV7632138.1 hypothetical protein [Acinetobacter baumannii]MDV7671614.1 hypothetical protein [Acinetobacter baumannii]
MDVYVCSAIEIVNNVQTCTAYVPLSIAQVFNGLAITQEDSIAISKAIAEICGLLIAYSFIMKAAKLA